MNMPIRTSAIMARVCSIIAVMTLAACASVEGKFTETTVADLPIFADQTLALMGGEDPGLSINETILIREYLTGEDPSEQLIDDLAGKADTLLVAIADYSLELALLADTVTDPEEQKPLYIENLSKLENVVTDTLDLQELDLKANIAAATQQDTLLEAMRTAQPIVDALGRHGLLLLGQHDDGVAVVASHVEEGIEQDYAGLYEYGTWLGGHRDAVLQELGELIEKEAEGENIARREEALIARLQVIDRLAGEVGPHWEIYRSAQRELDYVHGSVLDSSNGYG